MDARLVRAAVALRGRVRGPAQETFVWPRQIGRLLGRTMLGTPKLWSSPRECPLTGAVKSSGGVGRFRARKGSRPHRLALVAETGRVAGQGHRNAETA